MFRSNRERILLIVLVIIGGMLTLNISNAIAETIYSNDGSGASCDCIVAVEEGTGDWDHGECNDYDPWQYWSQGGGNWTCDESQIGSGNCMMPHYCDGTTEPPPDEGTLIELAEMGGFVEGTWQWNTTFEAEFDAWAGPGWNWRELFTPYKTEPTVTDSRMDFKHFPNKPNHVRVAVMMSGTGTMIPSIRRSESNPTAFFVDLVEPPGCESDEEGNIAGAQECVQECYDDPNCTPTNLWHDASGNGTIDCVDDDGYCEFSPDYTKAHPNPCCWFWDTPQFRLVNEVPFTADRFVTMLWDKSGNTTRNLPASLSLVDEACMYGVNYNNDRTVMEWVDSGWSDCFYDSYFVFPDNIDPDLGTNTFILTYDGSKTVTLKYDVINNGPMPVVPAKYTQAVTMNAGKSGKQITTGQTITVDNITARVLNNALVIQWAEPDLAMFPDPNAWRKELQCSVGTPYPSDWVGQTVIGHQLWIGSPYQIGSIVVPPHMFEFIKDKVRPDGNQLEIQFQYRFKYPPTPQQQGEGYWIYQNRGYGEPVLIDFE